MPPEYLELARKRVEMCWPGYQQPEEFRYNFRDWVSPYTKGAHALGGIAIVLQDWTSADFLIKGPDPDIQRLGRSRERGTNERLDVLLQRVMDTKISNTYVTNVFPFIKPGGMSEGVPRRDVLRAAKEFTRHELAIVRPKVILALGRVPTWALRKLGIECIGLPHPAARIGNDDAHERVWRQEIGEVVRSVRT